MGSRSICPTKSDQIFDWLPCNVLFRDENKLSCKHHDAEAKSTIVSLEIRFFSIDRILFSQTDYVDDFVAPGSTLRFILVFLNIRHCLPGQE